MIVRFLLSVCTALIIPSAVVVLPVEAAPSLPASPIALNKTAPIKEFTVVNNHTFAVHEIVAFPVETPSGDVPYVADQTLMPDTTSQVRQLQLSRDGDRVVARLVIALPPGTTAHYTIRPGKPSEHAPVLSVAEVGAFPSGLPNAFRIVQGDELPIFDLFLVEDANDLDDFAEHREERVRASIVASSKAGKLNFRRTSSRSGPVFAEFRYEAEGGRFNDYHLDVVHRVYAFGAIDTDVTIRTLALRTPKTYLALAKFMPTAAGEGAMVRWKGDLISLPAGGASPPRTVRSDNWTRDVSWLALEPVGGGNLARPLLARFVNGLTRIDRDTLRNVNDFLINEFAVSTDAGWTLLSEIARDQRVLKNYIPQQFVSPGLDEPVVLEYRTLPPDRHTPQSVNNAFTAFAGYQGANLTAPEKVRLEFGVAGVQFGTSLFPNSTYGENFEFWRSAGLIGGRPNEEDLNRWWPRFKNAYLFKGAVQRDLRIANAMGLDWIRIHHFDSPDFRQDYLQTEEGKWMLEYLDVVVSTARECGLGIFLDFSLSPNDIAFVAHKYGDVIRYYEIQNEVLIEPGARRDLWEYWMKAKDRIEQERPGTPVLITGAAQFFGIFDGLEQRGISFNTTGQHAYVDRREIPAHFSDIAVSLGGYATRRGTYAVNSEFNWRMITRETEEAQAAHFTELATNLFEPRCIPLALQFQFQETFCVPPRTRGALRHYEPLRVDRTPKPQAQAYRDIIRKYGLASNRLRQLVVEIVEVRLTPGKAFTYDVSIENVSGRPLSLKVAPRLPHGLSTAIRESNVELAAGEKRLLNRKGSADDTLKPGVYHIFEEVRFDDEVLFGWGVGRHVAAPELDLERPRLRNVSYEGGVGMLAQVDLSSLTGAVFGKDAPALEVDWALYIYHSLRSATGAPVMRETDDTLRVEEAAQRNLVLVGTPVSNALIKAIAAQLPASFANLRKDSGLVTRVDAPLGHKGVVWLIVTGADTQGVERAASDFLYRYWRFAKDAVAFGADMPPIEGSWTGSESERKFPKVRKRNERDSTETRALAIQLPTSIGLSQEFRVTAIDSAEPPAPAEGVTIGVYRAGVILKSAVTNAAGEARFRIDQAGDYEIRIENVPGSATRFTVKKMN